MRRPILLATTLLLLFMACREDKETLFRLVPENESGITFSNTITENDSVNIIELEYIYNGGAVATGDFNNDGLTDIYFSGNQVSSKLYLNRGNLRFEDVTEVSGLSNANKWRAGIALADVNADGFLDIYECATIKKDSLSRENILYISQGLNDQGVPVFEDEAKKFGLADAGHSQNAAFLDYDLDGDLDLYILTNTYFAKAPSAFREKIKDGSSPTTDRLYRNNGNNTFTNVSKQAGVTIEGYGLGLAIADFNNDRYPDIYVGNDYLTNDILYINNQDGTFTDQIDQYIKHQSQFSMGNDVADINNDGFLDIITLDMLPEKNLRRKTVISGVNYSTYINADKFGYTHQYVRNMLQLNNGNGTFSEIGQLAGIHQTEWSWSPLQADFDNDGYRDLLITNGFPKDVTDKDFGNYRLAAGPVVNTKTLLDSIPTVKVSNYGFKNNGDLTFTDVTNTWGLAEPSFSNGAAFADLDNDGDLDYIVNNINSTAFVYENTLNKNANQKKSCYLRIKLKGDKQNASALGAKVSIHYGNGKMQYHDHSIYRGYLSSVEDIIHFGLGEDSVINTIKIIWPDGKMTKMSEVHCNQLLTLTHSDDASTFVSNVSTEPQPSKTLFSQFDIGSTYKHEDDDRIDFNLQRTIPHKYTQYGPGIAIGDLNNDGLEDFYTSGSAGKNGYFFIQQSNGAFKKIAHATKSWEDLGVLLFDADNDNDLDLYTVSGSQEWQPDDTNYLDHLYINDGKGNFKERENALPRFASSGSCARAADFDADGDLDLFVGGRLVPGKYPLAAESVILMNNGGTFSNVTESVAPAIRNAGLVTDGIWTDFDQDGKIDLIVVGELMPVKFFKNSGYTLVEVTSETGIDNFKGWWNSIIGSDFDADGDIDYVAGNIGMNHYYRASQSSPVKVIAKDFDNNGSIDPIISCYFLTEEGTPELCPVHFWDELNQLSPRFRRQFSKYKGYGRTTTEQLLSEDDMKDASVLEGNHMATSYIENLGGGKFKLRNLPMAAQIAPANGILTEDYNRDGFADLLMCGNDYGNDVFSGKLDASIGLLLIGDGTGNFTPISPLQSGFIVNGDAKALTRLYNKNDHEIIIASQNKDSLKIFTSPMRHAIFTPSSGDKSVSFVVGDGKVKKAELYYGSGFLSQSSRKIKIPENTKEIIVTDFANRQRKIVYQQTARR